MNLRKHIGACVGRVFHRRDRSRDVDQHAHEQYIERAARGLQTKKSEYTATSRPDNLPWGT